MDLQKLLTMLDGSGREPRQVQIDVLRFIANNWKNGKHQVINAPVATGKSLIFKSLMNQVPGPLVVPNNILVSQYTDDTYPDMNKLIGRDNYHCKKFNVSCGTAQEKFCINPCEACPFDNAKERARDELDTVYNSMTLLIYRRIFGMYDKSVPTYVDEAHSLISLLREVSSYNRVLKPEDKIILNKVCPGKTKFDELDIAAFLQESLTYYERQVAYSKTIAAKNKLEGFIEKMKMTLGSIQHQPGNYAIQFLDGRLQVLPIFLPRYIIKQIILGKGILMSGTMLGPDIEEILGNEPYDYLDVESPIPKERRKIYYQPSEFSHSALSVDAEALVKRLELIINENEGVKRRTMIHLPYALAEKMQPHWTIPVISHDKLNKGKMLKKFKDEGGVLIASGMSEGVDLPEDMCRLNIVGKIPYASQADLFVRKRMQAANGDRWYCAESIKTLQQMPGRSTRSEKDFSVTIILDPSFSNLYKKAREYGFVSKSFAESIVWNKEDIKWDV